MCHIQSLTVLSVFCKVDKDLTIAIPEEGQWEFIRFDYLFVFVAIHAYHFIRGFFWNENVSVFTR